MPAPSLSMLVVLGYVATSAIAFAAYGIDKAAARSGRRRIPEATLHTLGLFGGWPGALLGQMVFRHKTRKRAFRIVFWATVGLNIAMLVAAFGALAQRMG